jgi:hypothetical protein
VQVVPRVPLDTRHHQRRVREARRDATVVGPEDRPQILHVHVVVRHVIDVLRLDAEGAQLHGQRVELARDGALQARGHARGEAREVGRRPSARHVGRVEEQRLERAALEELHDQAPVHEEDVRRRRERRGEERVLRGVGRHDDRQRPHGDGARPRGEPIPQPLGGEHEGAEARAGRGLVPRAVEVGERPGSRR